MKLSMRRLIPFFLILLLIVFLWKALYLQKTFTPEHQGGNFPSFSLADVRDPHKIITLGNLKGEPTIVHIWATWCSICVKEHDEWLKITKKWPIRLMGVVYRDQPNVVLNVLQQQGDPYQLLLNDEAGTLGLNLGLVGTPETFLVDAQGVIQLQHLGPVNRDVFEKEFLPVLEKMKQEK